MKKNKCLLNVFHIIDIVTNIRNYQYHFRLLLLSIFSCVERFLVVVGLGGVLFSFKEE